MVWKVDDKEYGVANYGAEVRIQLFQMWSEQGAKIECLCQKTNDQLPLLHILAILAGGNVFRVFAH